MKANAATIFHLLKFIT